MDGRLLDFFLALLSAFGDRHEVAYGTNVTRRLRPSD